MKIFCLILLAASVSLATNGLPYFSKKDLTPYWPEEKGVSHAEPAGFSNFSLIDQDQKTVNDKSAAGKAILVNFFFATCRSICPLMMNKVQDFQSQFRKQHPKTQWQILSISTMPEKDSPAELKSYATKRHLDLNHWSLLTGDVSQVDKLGRTVFQQSGPSTARDIEEPLFDHSSNLYLLDSQWHIRGVYDSANSKQMALLEEDLLKLDH